MLILNLGCGEGFKAKSGELGLSLGDINGVGVQLIPQSDKIDGNCNSSPNYDACLFQKSPVAQQNAVLSNQSRSSMAELQTFGVKINDLNGSGFLENSSIRILTSHTPRLKTTQNLKASVLNGSELEQVMTYYYLNRTIEYLSARGPLAVRNQNIPVLVDDRVSGFRLANKTIYLSRKDGRLPSAFDASEAVYLLGLANAHLASGGRLYNLPSKEDQHKMCGLDAKGCCSSRLGCARALASGAATYTTALMFPEKPVIGELGANRLAGVRLCGAMDRDLRTLTSVTATSAFVACEARKGDVNILGSLYASIWWEIRKAFPAETYKVDHIFLRHLLQLTAEDTFLTAKEKVLGLDRTLNGGDFSERIAAEFAKRGI